MQAVDAYRACGAIARSSGTSFYRGMRLLPKPKRDALFAVYAFARRVDDVADGDLPRDEQLAQLESLRRRDDADDPVFVALADVCTRFAMPEEAFDDLVDGAEQDVRGASFETFDDLEA